MAFILPIAKYGSRMGLESIKSLLAVMGNPESSVPAIHVAGTNGKGSVTANLTSILSAAGYRVGRFTSPDLYNFNERINISEKNFSKDIADIDIIRITEEIKGYISNRKDLQIPTVFELSTAIAFKYFKECNCDILVLETGLGGRLDATNVIPAPLAAVITPIGKDHLDILGDSIEKIALEKAGIIKSGCLVVSSDQTHEAKKVLINVCEKQKCELHIIENEEIKIQQYDIHFQTFSTSIYRGLRTTLLGEHQANNAALAAKTLYYINKYKDLKISEEAIYEGLLNCRFKGRFELIRTDPFIAIVDGAHNAHGVLSLRKSLERYFADRKIIFILGVLKDKNYKEMIEIVSPLAKYFFTITPNSSRALSANELTDFIQKNFKDIKSKPAGSVEEAINMALKICKKDDILCAFGSLYFIGDARNKMINVN